MQHVKVDLPKAISMVLKQIEIAGADFQHRADPNHPNTGGTGCYNMFVSYDYDDAEMTPIYNPGCLIGRVVIDSYEGDRNEIYAAIDKRHARENDFWGLTDNLKNGEILHFDYTDAAGRYLRKAQVVQDNYNPWGVAHSRALSEILAERYDSLIESEKEFFEVRKVLDFQEAYRLVSEVIEEKGEDFTHQDDPNREYSSNGGTNQCVNVFVKREPYELHRDYIAPGCLVGSAIHKAGWELETFGQYDVIGGPSHDLLRRVLEDELYTDVTPAADAFMRWVQSAQDNGANWGAARQDGFQKTLLNSDKELHTYSTFKFSTRENRWLDTRHDWQLSYMGETTGRSI